MKQTTITIVNDADGINLIAFDEAAKFCDIEYKICSQLSGGLLDISLKYSSDEKLFILGCSFQLKKTQLL